jgi:CO/xanthine dehydrogenase Mo-binding subunit/aerobic-type carbon monoxide dehydrogenase small subunit (CoxS/CutS family)
MSNPKKGDDTPGSEAPLDPGRRSFLQGAAGTAAASVGLGLGIPGLELLAREHAQVKGPQAQESGKNKIRLELRVNGKRVNLDVPHYRTLLLVLRENLGLTGTKKGCNLGQCGACTVLMDGAPVYACMMLAADATGKEILTIEALERGGTLHPVQQAFIDAMGSQCGHCTPGMILSAVALLRENPQPTPEDVRRALSGNLCRCGNYPNAITAVLLAAELEVSRWTNLAASPAPVYAPRTPPARVSKAETGKPVRLLDSSRPALDAYAKVSGRARFTGDLGFHADDEVRETLVAKVIRSPYPHAEVLRIDDSQAWRLAGYRGMVTWVDVPSYRNDRRFLNRHARYVGDAVAAIAADDQYTAQEALKLLDVQWRELSVYPDAEYNLSHDVRAIHEDGCVAGFDGPQPADVPTIEYRDGNLEVGFEAADLIVEGRFVTPVHCHAPSEPHCCIASLRGGKLTVWDSQQSVFHARAILAEALHLEPDNIRVVCEYLGGGFGGKCLDTLGKTLYQGIAATLSRMTARPVRLEYTLKETLLAEDARNPFIFILRTGVKRDGTLTAMQCKAIQATGGYASTGPGVVAVGGEGIINTYRCDNYWFQGYSVYTNSPVGGEFRGFGHPQAVFARERHMDDIARRLGINPLELRRRNSKRTGDPVTLGVATNTPLGNIGAQQCMSLGAEVINWGRWQPPGSQSGRCRRGLGMRVSQEHTGRSHSDALIWIDRHGQVHLPLGVGNLGTHAATGIALIAAETLHMPVEAINVSWGDTADTAWDFVTDASRSVHCTGKAVYNAARDLAGQLKALAAKLLKVDRGQLVVRDGRVLVTGSQRFVDFRTLTRRAPLRSSFLPVFDSATDRNPLIDENTGVLHQAPAMRLHPATERLAHAVANKGGLVGLGHYVFNPGVQAWGASFAEVEVDVETGQVNVLKLVCAHDIGRIIYRKGAEAQVYGGTIMGFGYAMMEELVCDPHHHVPLNASLYELRIPTVLDYPDIVSILVEAPVAAGPFGAKGLGENPMFNAAAAIGNAIHNATGVRVHELPFNWPRMYRALETLRLAPRDKTLSLPPDR